MSRVDDATRRKTGERRHFDVTAFHVNLASKMLRPIPLFKYKNNLKCYALSGY